MVSSCVRARNVVMVKIFIFRACQTKFIHRRMSMCMTLEIEITEFVESAEILRENSFLCELNGKDRK